MSVMKRVIFHIFIGALLIAGTYLYLKRGGFSSQFFAPTESSLEEVPLTVVNEEDWEISPPEIIADNLEIPWEIAFLPDGDLLVTERPGRLLRIGENRVAVVIEGVAHRGEGGLLGLALDPNFDENNFIYLYLTTESAGGLSNQVERYRLSGTTLTEREVVIENIPGARNHDGGRIAFGPDGLLYITTGDAGTPARAQDVESLAGKILRVHADGTIPGDNPFNNAVYSYGHRNPQGITWNEDGQLWATEHGRSGALSGYDEVNKIEKGGNYGWPNIQGDERAEGMIGPQLHSGATETWAPAGIASLDGHLLFTGLRVESLYSANISSGVTEDLKRHLTGTYGRLRAVVEGPDGMLYILTNNRDGRGEPRSTDDRIIKIDPRSLGL